MEGAHEEYKKGFWNVEEDRVLMDYVKEHGIGKWNRIAKVTGLKRCGKSCRQRWMNYLSPNVNRGDFSKEEEDLIIRLHKLLGNRWSLIAGRIPGRTDSQVKNYWNIHLSKKLIGVKKERSKVRSPPKAVPNEPKDSCNSTSEGTRHLEHNGEGEKLDQQANSSGGDQNSTTSTHEVLMGDEFGSSFWFANSELNLCTASMTGSLQEYFVGFDRDAL